MQKTADFELKKSKIDKKNQKDKPPSEHWEMPKDGRKEVAAII